MTDIVFEFDFMYLYIALGVAWFSSLFYTFFPITHWVVLILATVIAGVLFFGNEGFSGLSANNSNSKEKQMQGRADNALINCSNTPEGFFNANGELNICITKKFN